MSNGSCLIVYFLIILFFTRPHFLFNSIMNLFLLHGSKWILLCLYWSSAVKQLLIWIWLLKNESYYTNRIRAENGDLWLIDYKHTLYRKLLKDANFEGRNFDAKTTNRKICNIQKFWKISLLRVISDILFF